MVDIHKRFGPTIALNGVSLEVRRGEVLALLGENGAGKSTLMKVFSGALAPDRGRMFVDGRPYAPRGPHAAHASGVAMIYQELSLAPHLSVEDNVMLGQEHHRMGWLLRTSQRERVRGALALLGHGELSLHAPVGTLSVAEQQVVEIARALVRNSRVLVLDEPTSSLTRADVEKLFGVIARLRESGFAVVYVSHFLEEVFQLADRFLVLRDGAAAGEGRIQDVTEDELVRLLVGKRLEEQFPHVPHEPGEEVLKADAVSGAGRPLDVSFNLRQGEIFGLAGLVSSGRTELVRLLYGLDAARRGRVWMAGRRLVGGPRSRIAAGLGFVSEDRKAEGLALPRSIAENMTWSRLAPFSFLGLLNPWRCDAEAAGWMARLEIRGRSPGQAVGELSGGNQQKVALARVLHQDADVLLLDEPTRGIDVKTKADLYRLMGELAARGRSVIFVSSYFRELLAVCDRVGVIVRGRLAEVRAAREWTEETLMSRAVGG
jgi:ribose transport system ATP-binding protein